MKPDARKPFFDAIQTINTIIQTLSVADNVGVGNTTANPDLDRLRGHKGAGARAYFTALASVMPPALAFFGRNRRPPRDPVNVCLFLGYTLLHSQAVVACSAAGLDPLLGFYHRPTFGRESLASDLIEPLRPALDLWVWELLRSRTLREEHLTQDKGACLMGKAGRSVFYAQWIARSKLWQRWLRLQCQPLARSLRHQGSEWLNKNAMEDEYQWD